MYEVSWSHTDELRSVIEKWEHIEQASLKFSEYETSFKKRLKKIFLDPPQLQILRRGGVGVKKILRPFFYFFYDISCIQNFSDACSISSHFSITDLSSSVRFQFTSLIRWNRHLKTVRIHFRCTIFAAISFDNLI